MEKGGELKTRLSERLAQRQAEELAAVATLTEANLIQLSERLTKHVSAELSTTGDAIRQQSEQITTLLGSQQIALEQQQATVDALKRLSLTDLEQIQEGLHNAITLAQGKAIEQAIDPLRTALAQLKTDGEALSLVTFRGWLKPDFVWNIQFRKFEIYHVSGHLQPCPVFGVQSRRNGEG